MVRGQDGSGRLGRGESSRREGDGGDVQLTAPDGFVSCAAVGCAVIARSLTHSSSLTRLTHSSVVVLLHPACIHLDHMHEP